MFLNSSYFKSADISEAGTKIQIVKLKCRDLQTIAPLIGLVLPCECQMTVILRILSMTHLINKRKNNKNSLKISKLSLNF